MTRITARPARRVHGTHFALAVSPLPEGTGPKFTCVVSKKTASKAADRNRIKRHCREAMRSVLRGRTEHRAYVLHAKAEARSASGTEITVDIERLMEKSHG